MRPPPAIPFRLAIVAIAAAIAAPLAACPAPTAKPGTASVTPRPFSDINNPMPPPDLPTPPPPTARPTPAPPAPTAKRGIPDVGGAWLDHRGPVSELGDLTAVAAKYRLIVVDADPELKYVTPEQIATLRAGGKNRVLSVLGVGAMETARPFWGRIASKLEDAHIGLDASGQKMWLDPGFNGWQLQLVGGRAKPFAASTGVDGFLLTDVALAEHLADAADGPCPGACRQAVLDTIYNMRASLPDMLLVVSGATSDVVRLGTTRTGEPIAPMLDGVVGEGVYAPAYDELAELRLSAWKDMGMTLNGHPFFVGTADVVASCDATAARDAAAKARAKGFAAYVSDKAAPPRATCPID